MKWSELFLASSIGMGVTLVIFYLTLLIGNIIDMIK